jgi:hypothetical protein
MEGGRGRRQPSTPTTAIVRLTDDGAMFKSARFCIPDPVLATFGFKKHSLPGKTGAGSLGGRAAFASKYRRQADLPNLVLAVDSGRFARKTGIRGPNILERIANLQPFGSS